MAAARNAWREVTKCCPPTQILTAVSPAAETDADLLNDLSFLVEDILFIDPLGFF
eukprot:CAMPEP_0172001114 /NCGR_PEP_ID=MMETSP1041-20130122/2692_1 /TAXON_ID=464988 /ORGANISM="Hemiselmis andersenii, Strain CCMP439" /LENGTH=54 /DNA_ID=CAMNT_0012654723 /DNA_START=520 /DNA_END=681 /DNA_ORIENTATION=-